MMAMCTHRIDDGFHLLVLKMLGIVKKKKQQSSACAYNTCVGMNDKTRYRFFHRHFRELQDTAPVLCQQVCKTSVV